MSETIERSFSVTTPANLSISNICGSVKILPGEEGVVQVTATKQDQSGDQKQTEIDITQEADGTVKIVTRFPNGSWNWLSGSHPCEVDYVVKAPHLCSLKMNGVSSTLLAEGFEGTTNVNSVSGEIDLRNLTGNIKIHTVSGDTSGERLNGSLDLDTVSGDVALEESNFGTIKSNAVSGDVKVRTSITQGPYGFKSVSGDVRLIVPDDTRCTGELHSLSGDILSVFPITSYSHHHGSQSIDIQGGGTKVTLHSVSGDLSLDCDGKIPHAAEPMKTSSIEERRDVLERVERGELTVEQALAQLHG